MSKEPHPGDWECPGCLLVVFAHRSECIRCGFAKAGEYTVPKKLRAKVSRPLANEETISTKCNNSLEKGTQSKKIHKQSQRSRHNKKRRLRQSARKPRFAAFARWIKEKFGNVMLPGCSVLDVAGGSGGLCWELVAPLSTIDSIRCTVIDPNPVRFSRRKTENLIRAALVRVNDCNFSVTKVENVTKIDSQIKVALDIKCLDKTVIDKAPAVVSDTAVNILQKRGAQQLKTLFNADFCSGQNPNGSEISKDLWQKCVLVVGLHPDQATDSIVDLALKHQKPFAVVPCSFYIITFHLSIFFYTKICT